MKTKDSTVKKTGPIRVVEGSRRQKAAETLQSVIQATPLTENVPALEKAVSSPIGITNSQDAWVTHLAQLLHSMYLVSFTEKAQLGSIYPLQGGAGPSSTASRLENDDAAALRRAAPTVPIDERWLAAVTRYSNSTVTLDDVAKVTRCFSRFMQMRWVAAPLSDGMPAVRAACEETPDRHFTTSAAALEPWHVLRSRADPNACARLCLLQSRVPSVDDAKAHLLSVIEAKGNTAAQQQWKNSVTHFTAIAAYRLQVLETQSPSEKMKVEEVLSKDDSHAVAVASLDAAAPSREDKGDAVLVSYISDAELLAQMSPDLRHALSAEKQLAVLRQLRRDVAQVDVKEQAAVQLRHTQERLVSAYEHLRSLFGTKLRSLSAARLLSSLHRDSLFHSAQDGATLLSSLLAIDASGLTAATILKSTVTAVEGEKKEKRRRTERGRSVLPPAPPLPSVADAETVISIKSVEGFSAEALDFVLVTFDPAVGSVKGVINAVGETARHSSQHDGL